MSRELPAYWIFVSTCCVLLVVGCGEKDATANRPPTVSALTIIDSNNGEPRVGDRLVGHYIYTDVESDPEANSGVRWLRDSVPIRGMTGPSYRIRPEDAGHRLSFEVGPRAATGARNGRTARSAAIEAAARRGTRATRETLVSKVTGHSYILDVHLPEGYSSGTASFPAIYQLTPEDTFLRDSATIDATATDVVLVSFGHYTTELRYADYSLPLAHEFFEFIKTELIPHVESRYRIKPDQRILSGHSLGGLFAGLALLMDAPERRLFSRYLISDGSFWLHVKDTIKLEAEHATQTNTLPAQVLMVGATRGNMESVRGYHWLLKQRAYAQLELTLIELDGRHEEASPFAFTEGLSRLVEPLQ